MANMRPYGLAISDAIERGDARRLTSLVEKAKALHEEQGGDLSKAIRAGESALKKLAKAAGTSTTTPAKTSSKRK
jgi:hypothetical protein